MVEIVLKIPICGANKDGSYDSVSDKRLKMGAQMRYFRSFRKTVKVVFKNL